MREYVINPIDAIKKLLVQNNTDDYPAENIKIESIKNINQLYIEKCRERIASINQRMINNPKITLTLDQRKSLLLERERLFLHIQTIPRDIKKISNINKKPIEQNDENIFNDMPIFPLMRTNYEKLFTDDTTYEDRELINTAKIELTQ